MLMYADPTAVMTDERERDIQEHYIASIQRKEVPKGCLGVLFCLLI